MLCHSLMLLLMVGAEKCVSVSVSVSLAQEREEPLFAVYICSHLAHARGASGFAAY